MQILISTIAIFCLLPLASSKKGASDQELDFFSLSFDDLINIGIQDGLCLSQELIEEEYKLFLYGARLKRS